MAEKKLSIVVKTKDKSSKIMKKIGASAVKMAKVVAAAGVAAALAIGKVAVDAAIEFDKALSTIRKGTGATGKELEAFGRSARTVFKSVPEDIETVGNAIGFVNSRLAITGPALEETTKGLIDMARVMESDVRPTVDNMTRVYGDWSVAVEDITKTNDFFLNVIQKTNADFLTVSKAVVDNGSTMRDYGFTLEETTVLFARWQAEGVNTTKILGGLNQAQGKFAKAGKNSAIAIREFMDRIKDTKGQAAMAKLKVDAVNLLGGPNATDFILAVKEGRFAVEDFLGAVEASGDTVSRAAEEALTFGEKWAIAGNRAKDVLLPLGELILGLAEDMLPLAEASVEFIDSLANLTIVGDDLEDVSQNIGLVEGVITEIMNSGFGEWIIGIGESIVSAFDWLVGGQLGIDIGIALDDLAQKWSGMKLKVEQTIRSMWRAIKSTFTDSMDTIKRKITEWATWITDKFEWVYTLVQKRSSWPDMWNGIVSTAKWGTESTKKLVSNMADDVVKTFDKLSTANLTPLVSGPDSLGPAGSNLSESEAEARKVKERAFRLEDRAARQIRDLQIRVLMERQTDFENELLTNQLNFDRRREQLSAHSLILGEDFVNAEAIHRELQQNAQAQSVAIVLDHNEKLRKAEEATVKATVDGKKKKLAAFKSLADGIGKLLGIQAKQMALVMIPLEAAQAATAIAQSFRAFAMGDAAGGALFATEAVAHLTAIKSWMAAGKGGGGGGGSSASAGGGGGGGGAVGGDGAQAGGGVPGAGQAENVNARGRAGITVIVGEGVITDPQAFTQTILESIGPAINMDLDIEVTGESN